MFYLSLFFIFIGFIIIVWAMKSSLGDYEEIERIYGPAEMIRRII